LLISFDSRYDSRPNGSNRKSDPAAGNWSAARTTWIADAHGYGKRFIVRGDEILIAFVELQRAIHEFAVGLIVQWPRKRCADEKLTAFLEMEKSGLYPPVD